MDESLDNQVPIVDKYELAGFTKKTGFLAGLTVAQIGEFSLITVALGQKVGHISNEVLSVITMVSLITIGISTYMVLYSGSLYKTFSKYLSLFEKKDLREKKKISKMTFVFMIPPLILTPDTCNRYTNQRRDM